MKKLKTLNYLLQKIGVELIKYNPRNNALLRKKFFFNNYEFDLVIDVGANNGSFGRELRGFGYEGMICSFEPIKEVFEKLQKETKNDRNWKVFNFALGANIEEIEINISSNSHSSSILDILPSHITADPTSTFIRKEKIAVKKLDSIFPEIGSNYKNIYLKIDTQGFEYQVIVGSKISLSKINTVQIEMSLLPLYEGQVLFDELYNFLTSNGFTLINIESGFVNPKNGELLQLDGVFIRK